VGVNLLKNGIATYNLPPILKTYLFCCPTLDCNLRCLPRAGGYYDQYFYDMLCFNIIEQKIIEIDKQKK